MGPGEMRLPAIQEMSDMKHGFASTDIPAYIQLHVPSAKCLPFFQLVL